MNKDGKTVWVLNSRDGLPGEVGFDRGMRFEAGLADVVEGYTGVGEVGLRVSKIGCNHSRRNNSSSSLKP